MSLETLLENMWQDYCAFNPSAFKIYQAFREKGETILNDHIALRTLDHPRLGISSLARHFVELGYEAKKDYVFEEKKLRALHFEHKTNPKNPKIFISELELGKMSSFVRKKMNELAEQTPQAMIDRPDFAMAGRPWSVSHEDYLKLADESEYASWLAAFGFRPNHFTVSVNDLKSFKGLAAVNDFVKSLGFNMNTSGGEIKGSPEQLLEQSSTMAEETLVEFEEGRFPVPACYYEFALRHKQSDGHLYQGFVASSADKIFESTDRSRLH